MLHALYHRHALPYFRQSGGHALLEAAVAKALLDGALAAGDRIATPHQLGRRLGLSPSEVLDSISRLLAQRILRQDDDGLLSIHEAAVPPQELSPAVHALRARQLKETARTWDGPSNTLRELLRQDDMQVA